ncbi:murein tripeptide amidase MpaA [Vibrio sp. S17_S38]|uniref:murein tripeptide amidase MpaA n=1 Tax=Vibrio sp. S17_S38 TaxID=2720229 RepID=UPI001680A249|nr:murein tripeptide amidase MpaA [Vibrio sp. S17_S38]MBD1572033.1 murein tripeptide amidase MpaA [Vibrio sp. S17_S38]
MTTSLRSRQQRGQFQNQPVSYGQSVLGAALLYFPAQVITSTTGLIIAGTHGDETASITSLSCALRSIQMSNLHHHVILSMNPDGNQLGTRANANGVDLNRNFASQNWQKGGTVYRWNTKEPERDVFIGTGETGNSEPETQALCDLIEQLNPAWVASFHEPLACIDDPANSTLGQWFANQMNLPVVGDVGYDTPGSFGSWCAERDLLCVTVELPPVSSDFASEEYESMLVKLLTGQESTNF